MFTRYSGGKFVRYHSLYQPCTAGTTGRSAQNHSSSSSSSQSVIAATVDSSPSLTCLPEQQIYMCTVPVYAVCTLLHVCARMPARGSRSQVRMRIADHMQLQWVLKPRISPSTLHLAPSSLKMRALSHAPAPTARV